MIAGYADSRWCVCQSCLKSLVLVVVRSRVLSWFGNLVLVVVKTYSHYLSFPLPHDGNQCVFVSSQDSSSTVLICAVCSTDSSERCHGGFCSNLLFERLSSHAAMALAWRSLLLRKYTKKGLYLSHTHMITHVGMYRYVYIYIYKPFPLRLNDTPTLPFLKNTWNIFYC